jgi:hypothetical protein
VVTTTVGPDPEFGTKFTLVVKSYPDASWTPSEGEIVMLLPGAPEWIERLAGFGGVATKLSLSPDTIPLVPPGLVTTWISIGAVVWAWPGVITVSTLSLDTRKQPES